ncbi:hypothetical protein LSPH24S_06963 [Lysinibacillus sphaericus]
MQQTTLTPANQPLALKQGQVFHGTIKQLYPDQTAEVQVGNQKLIAKLEVPLKAGDAHFFQVTGTSPQTELKVVTGPDGARGFYKPTNKSATRFDEFAKNVRNATGVSALY